MLKRMSFLAFCLMLLFTLLKSGIAKAEDASQNLSNASSVTSSNHWDWPDSLDAVNAASENHKILFENERVRVLEVTIPPHTREKTHSHRYPSVIYVDSGKDFRDFDINGNVVFDSRKDSVPGSLPFTDWNDPLPPHSVENLSDVPIHLIRVELKK